MFKIKVSNSRNQDNKSAVATIGNYDGFHLGHMQLIDVMNLVAREDNLLRILITFEPLSKEFFADNKSIDRVQRISLIRDKYLILKNNNNYLADYLVILRFNHQLANTAAHEFIQQILINKLNIKHMVIGNDFKFGNHALGNKDTFKQYNIKTHVVEPYYINQIRVSSSIIRDYAKNNELIQLREFLGHNLHYTSKVIHGNHLGRKYGVPTINLCLGRNKPALWGIYVAYVYIDGVRYNAVASIGKNPTVSNLDIYKLEAHLLDVDLNLYGRVATVEILEFLRHECKFDNLEVLFKQIYEDIKNTRRYFNKVGNYGL